MSEHILSLWCGVGGYTTYPGRQQAQDIQEFVDLCAGAGITTLHPTLVSDDYMPAFAVFGEPQFGKGAPTIRDYYEIFNPWPLLVRTARLRNIETRPYLAINNHGWQLPKDDALVDENSPFLLGQRFAVQHPEFWALDRTGRPTVDINNSIILSVVHPEVRDHQTESLCNIVQRYDLSGIQLEYVSEPVDENGIAVTGYEDEMVSAYHSASGSDPRAIPNENPQWLEFRASFVSMQVKELRAALDGLEAEMNREIELSVSVCARERDEYLKVLQDWPAWVASGWIDRVCLWHREADLEAIRRRTQHAAEMIAGRCHLTSEISVYHKAAIHDADALVKAAKISLDSGANSLGVYRGDAVFVRNLWEAVAEIGRIYP